MSPMGDTFNVNSTGPNTEPWGTPKLSFLFADVEFAISLFSVLQKLMTMNHYSSLKHSGKRFQI